MAVATASDGATNGFINGWGDGTSVLYVNYIGATRSVPTYLTSPSSGQGFPNDYGGPLFYTLNVSYDKTFVMNNNRILFLTNSGNIFTPKRAYGMLKGMGNNSTTAWSPINSGTNQLTEWITGTDQLSMLATGGSFSGQVVWSGGGATANYLYGVGQNTYGQLNQNDRTNRTSWTWMASNVADVSFTHDGSFWIKTTGELWSVGYNGQGQLGLGNTTHISSAVQVGSLTNWSKIFAGYAAVMAIKIGRAHV